MLITGMTLEQVEKLEEIFAILTPEGWAIPEWLVLLRASVDGYDVVIEPASRL